MEERPITFNLLLKDELEYEVKIRESKPAATVVDLKAQIRNLNKEIPSDEILSCNLDVNSELEIIQDKLDCIENLISDKSKSNTLKALNRIQALAHHLFHRIGRLGSEDKEILHKIDILKYELDNKLCKLDNILTFFKTSLSQTSQIQTSPPTPLSQTLQCTDNNLASVHKLNLRYNGKTCVKAFLQRLEELCLSRGISDSKLFNSAAELFTDEALCWYRGVRAEVCNWPELKQLLLDEYLPSDYDHRLMHEIRSRTQGSDESIINYLSVMQNYFSRLSKPMSDEEKLGIVLFNIRPFYTSQLALNPVESWADLKRKGRLLEGAKERSQHFTEPPKNLQSSLAPDLCYKLSGRQSTPSVASIQADVMKNFCVRCRVEGHSLKTCKGPFVVVCYRCGEKGVTARSCKKCNSSTTGSKN